MPSNKSITFRVLNELQPIYPLSSGQVMSGYDYLEKINDVLGKKINKWNAESNYSLWTYLYEIWRLL